MENFKNFRIEGKEEYNDLYGHYKSDKYKSRWILLTEISDLIQILFLSKKELIEVRDKLKSFFI